VSDSIDEPVELRDRLRALATVAPGQVRSRLVDEIALVVAEWSGPRLSGRATTADVEAACRSYERELWLWLVGERTWAQCASGLSGRMMRRSAASR
jgi:hypothetical protein